MFHRIACMSCVGLDSLEYLKTAIEIGKALGADYTVISAGHAGYKATRKEIWERLYIWWESKFNFFRSK